MTENEAKKLIAKFCEDRMNFARGKDISDKELENFCKFSDALNISISSVEEIQQYRTIGTVEECREAREKQRAKKPILNENSNVMFCPVCERKIRRNYDLHCSGCGQAIDWSDTP